MAADDVSAVVADTAVGAPRNGVIEIGGPEVFGLDEWIRFVLKAKNDQREVIADPTARYFGTLLEDKTLAPGPDALMARSAWSTG